MTNFDLFHYPRALFVVSFVVLWGSAWLVASLRRAGLGAGPLEDLDLVLGATLTLLGLVIGFTFSMAINRYDQRKDLEEAEANAIGTQYVRANLLPAADAARVQDLLRQYLALRIRFYETRDEVQLAQIDASTAKMQSEMWAAVQAPAAVQPTPIVALAVAGMNDVLNSQGNTQAAFWNQIPMAAWGLMAAVAIGCNLPSRSE